MPLQTGLVGLPNAGKSSLFNALTNANALVASYPFATIEPNVGVVELPDKRLQAIVKVIEPREVVPAVVHFADIAGLVKGANQGEGLGNQFLGHIRNVDALVHVVRCFVDDNVAHVTGALNPVSDIKTVETELLLADIEAVGKRKERAEREVKTGERRVKEELAALQAIQEALNEGVAARRLYGELPISSREHEAEFWNELPLLTLKPLVYCANVSEDDVGGTSDMATSVAEYAEEQGAGFISICAKLEGELTELPDEEAALFKADLGLTESGLSRLATVTYKQLGLITFYTVKGPQTRAWSLSAGTLAPKAAGTIHSDMERGFIRAEVIGWEALVDVGSFAKAREKGLVRGEGKEYVIQDGDVVQFRFNV